MATYSDPFKGNIAESFQEQLFPLFVSVLEVLHSLLLISELHALSHSLNSECHSPYA